MKKPNKFLNWLKSFPTIVSLCIIIPSLVAITRYFFSIEYYYHNYYYTGETLDVDDATFEITGINKIGKVSQSSANYSYQGGACYENYYAVCLDNFQSILIYDAETMQLAHTVNTNSFNVEWHCNQIFFGPYFYKVSDKYPLLYVSMEHANVHSTIVFRIYQQAGEYYTEQVQSIKLNFSEDKDIIYQRPVTELGKTLAGISSKSDITTLINMSKVAFETSLVDTLASIYKEGTSTKYYDLFILLQNFGVLYRENNKTSKLDKIYIVDLNRIYKIIDTITQRNLNSNIINISNLKPINFEDYLNA